MSGGGFVLSAEDCDAIQNALCPCGHTVLVAHTSWEQKRCGHISRDGCTRTFSEALAETVEEIAQRAINAALNEAAEAFCDDDEATTVALLGAEYVIGVLRARAT